MKSNKHIIAIIEPSVAVSGGVKLMLDNHPDIEVAGVFNDLASFKNNTHEMVFSAILFNPLLVSIHKQFNARTLFSSYPDAAIAAIVYKHVNPATLSSFDGVIDIFDSRDATISNLLHIIEDKNISTGISQTEARLSKRETEIVVLAVRGFKNKDIADRLNISIHTVATHRKNIIRKVGIKTASGLTMYAMLNKLVSI